MMYELIFKTRVNLTNKEIMDYLEEARPITALQQLGLYFDSLEVKVVQH